MPQLKTLGPEDKHALKDVLSHGHGKIERADWIAMYDSFMKDFNQMDANNDGQVTREEWKAFKGDDDAFDAYDADGDGCVNADEYAQGRQIDRQFHDLDANNDGKISREEWIARYGSDAGFDEYDLDGDGIIDASEFRKCKAAEIEFTHLAPDGKLTREAWIARYGSDAGFDEYDLNGDGIVDPEEFRKVKAAEIDFRHLDTNRDGKISRDEWIARYGSDAGFDEYDLNGDGIIDADEFRQCKAAEIEATQGDVIEFADEAPNRPEFFDPPEAPVTNTPISLELWIEKNGSEAGYAAYVQSFNQMIYSYHPTLAREVTFATKPKPKVIAL